jgi:4-amino-4-deoxy-L-arabinose transferase-like glycosyltransferase
MRRQIVLLIFLGIVLFFLRLGSISVYQVAEARNAECASEMLARKDWVVPLFNGRLRTDKPALEYFAMITAYAIGGVGEGSARFFSALCGLLLVLATFLIGCRYLGRKAGWWAALALLASPHLIAQFRLATPDPYLILCGTLALYCFFEGWRRTKDRPEQWGWYGCMYVFLGLALLAKGPVGVLLPGLTMLLFLVFKRDLNWQTIRRLRPWWGALLTLLFSAPWYILVDMKTNGAWTRGFFLVHNIDRFSGTMGGHGGIFLLTFLFVFAGMLPFSVFIIHTLGYVWKQRRKDDFLLFSLVAFLVVLLFYVCSRTKLINYTVPCYPFLALMTGAFLSRLTTEKDILPRALRVPFWVLLALSVAIPVGTFFWIRSAAPLQGAMWIAVVLLLYPLGTAVAFILFARKRTSGALGWIAGVFMVGTAVLFAYPYPFLDARTPVRRAAPLFGKGVPVAAYKNFNDAFVFYNRRPIPVLEDTAALDRFLSTHQEAMIISDIRHQPMLEDRRDLEVVARYPEIFDSHVSVIYRKVKGPKERQAAVVLPASPGRKKNAMNPGKKPDS